MGHRTAATHEDYRRAIEVKSSSERTFGLAFAALFTLIAAWRWWKGTPFAEWWLVGAVLFALAGLVAPGILAPLNRAWVKLGLLLFYVINPLVLGILFYLVFLPIGLVLRWSGKDPLRLRFDSSAHTYWIDRSHEGASPGSMRNQF
jgi:hypothetical protein